MPARRFTPAGSGAYRLQAAFESNADEHLWGMGQYPDGLADLKGTTLELAHRNTQTSIPFVLSSRGYGFMWHNPAVGRVIFGRNETLWEADASSQLDYWVTAGSEPRAILANLADVTGHAPMMPERGLGLWQSKLRYRSAEEILEVAEEYRRRGLPLDVIVADFFHWPEMGDFRFDGEFWPDPEQLVSRLKEMDVDLAVSVWPQVGSASENFDAAGAMGLFVGQKHGSPDHLVARNSNRLLDMTNPESRRFIWEKCRDGYADLGIGTFWLDAAEPEYGDYEFGNYVYHAGDVESIGNVYPLEYARAFHEGQTEAGQKDVVNLIRSAWVGSQKYGALLWSGDVDSTWSSLRAQVTTGIHVGTAGIPWWTSDIGGFFGGDPESEAFRELLIRWFQFGAFCPVMRLHGDRVPAGPVTARDGTSRAGSGAANEIWSFGDTAYPILARYLRVREALRDYLRSCMEEAHRTGSPVLRGLFYEFPGDSICWGIGDSFMLGGELLVCPVLEPNAEERAVYLPQGCRWTSLMNGEEFEGGQRISVSVDIDSIPVFSRSGEHAELSRLLRRR